MIWHSVGPITVVIFCRFHYAPGELRVMVGSEDPAKAPPKDCEVLIDLENSNILAN